MTQSSGLEEAVSELKRDDRDQDRRIEELGKAVNHLTIQVEILKTQTRMVAAIGSLVGGAVVSMVAHLLK